MCIVLNQSVNIANTEDKNTVLEYAFLFKIINIFL